MQSFESIVFLSTFETSKMEIYKLIIHLK